VTKAKTIRKKAEPSEPPVLLFKEKTFEHMGMIATMIGGVVHFIDRSYARSIGIAERNVSTTVENNLPELELYGTVHAAHALFAVVGNDAKYPIKGYWLNSDQLMILLMKSSSAKAVEFRRRIVTLIRDLREGRLVYRDNALVAAEPRQDTQTAHTSPPSLALPFDLSKGLGPVPEVHEWAQRFAIKDGKFVDYRNIPRSAKTDEGITLHVVGTKVHFRDADVAMLAGSTEAAVDDLITANIAKFETHGQISKKAKAAVGRKKAASTDRLLNVTQTGMLLDLLEARGTPTSVRDRLGAIYKAYLEGTLADLCGDPVQRSNAIAIAQARLGYAIDAHGYVHRTHNSDGHPALPDPWLPPVRIDLARIISHLDGGKPVYAAAAPVATTRQLAPQQPPVDPPKEIAASASPLAPTSGSSEIVVRDIEAPIGAAELPGLIATAVSQSLAPLVDAILATRAQSAAEPPGQRTKDAPRTLDRIKSAFDAFKDPRRAHDDA
jgi:hypothetical protein